MSEQYETKTDKQLIHFIITDPDSQEGRVAKEVLEYRKYLATRRHNAWLLILTIVLATSASVQVIVNLINGPGWLLVTLIKIIIQIIGLK